MIKQIRLDNNFIVDCSVEVGFIDTFFSSRNPELGDVVYRKSVNESHDVFLFGRYSYSVLATDHYTRNNRLLMLEFQEDSLLMDIVQRFVIRKDSVDYININNKHHFHKRKNIYYQYDACDVEIKSKDGCRYLFKPSYDCEISGFRPVVYVRDEPDQWIFHVRLLSTKPDVFLFKGCSTYYNKPFPLLVQNVFSFLGLMHPLLYVRERYSQRIPFQANGASVIKKGSKIVIKTSWEKVFV